jgi:hypothetical protein
MSKRVLYVYLTLVAAYLLLSFLVPTERAVLERYKITEFQTDLLRLTIAIPLIAIWFAAFYGYDKFKIYAQTIHSAPDGRAFDYIANGLGVLAVSLPITSILTSIINYISLSSKGALPATTIISNYVAIALSLAAFWLIYKGSLRLAGMVSKNPDHNENYNLIVMITALLAVFYTSFTLQNPNRLVPTGSVGKATFYLSDWMILLTIVIPYLFIWFIGLQAVHNIGQYARSVKGILYKQLLGLLARGIVAIVLVTILLQFFKDFQHLLNRLALAPLLVIIYLLIVAIAVGYLYVAAGAKRLQKIEEV